MVEQQNSFCITRMTTAENFPQPIAIVDRCRQNTPSQKIIDKIKAPFAQYTQNQTRPVAASGTYVAKQNTPRETHRTPTSTSVVGVQVAAHNGDRSTRQTRQIEDQRLLQRRLKKCPAREWQIQRVARTKNPTGCKMLQIR